MSNAVNIAQDRLHELYEYRDGNFYRKTSARGVKAGIQSNYKADRGYHKIMIDKKLYKFHRVVFMYHHGYMPKMVDHINGDKSDNRIENLREVTDSQNRMNVGISCKNKSGVKNVHWHKAGNCWRVQVTHKQGVFTKQVEDLELAELIAIEARTKFHGEYANHGVSA